MTVHDFKMMKKVLPLSMKYRERIYRNLIHPDQLVTYNVKIEESDLLISSDSDLSAPAFKSLARHRHAIEMYINTHPRFLKSLVPLPRDPFAPPIVREMLNKSIICGVGPMAAIAGAVAEFVGNDLRNASKNLIVENGGDIYLQSERKLTVSVFAGDSPLSYKVNFVIRPEQTPLGICTSSATVGPSLSFGIADAVCVISKSAVLADAAASSIGNKVKSRENIKSALNFGMSIEGIEGVLIIVQNEMGVKGRIELV
jgi:ApbE superfamily uncharacterized protein (UPF0280 family)